MDKSSEILLDMKNSNEEILKLLEGIKLEVGRIRHPPSNLEGGLYEFKYLCGVGTSGSVYVVTDVRTKQKYAVKRIALTDNEISKNLAREMSILMDTQHENIVRSEKVFISPGCVNLVMEHIPHDLVYYMREHKELYKRTHIKENLKQLLAALLYMHQRSIMHRDITPENILVKKGVGGKIHLKVADFGLSKHNGDPHTPKVTTLQYRAPEILLGCETYTTAVDMWSVGCIFFRFMMSRPLVDQKNSKSEHDVITQIFKELGIPSESIWPGVRSLRKFPVISQVCSAEEHEISPELQNLYKLDYYGADLLLQLLCLNPRNRITAKEALRHRFLQDGY